MAALAMLAAVTAIAVALIVGSHLRSLLAETPASPSSGAPASALGYQPAE